MTKELSGPKMSFFDSFLQFLKKYSVFELLICSRRPPENRTKFFGLIKYYNSSLEIWNYTRKYFPRAPGRFLSKPLNFGSFLGNEEIFGRKICQKSVPLWEFFRNFFRIFLEFFWNENGIFFERGLKFYLWKIFENLSN